MDEPGGKGGLRERRGGAGVGRGRSLDGRGVRRALEWRRPGRTLRAVRRTVRVGRLAWAAPPGSGGVAGVLGLSLTSEKA